MQVILAILFNIIYFVHGDLSKPYTLKLQVMLPIGGEIAPLGDLCLEPMNLLLNTVNNQHDILPGYNLVLDVIDDKCLGSVALKEILPFFTASRVEENEIGKNFTKPGWYRLPYNHKASLPSAETAYVPPLVIGGLCSGVCTVVARNVQYFDLINFSAACNSEVLSNLKVYPNFYRIMANTQIVETAVQFIKAMQWSSISIISDSEPVNVDATRDTMNRLQQLNVQIASLEIFAGDPADAIDRVANSHSRVILVNCYFDMCPKIACRAYLRGLYGPRIIWIFPASIDIINHDTKLPKECTSDKLQLIDSGSFHQFQVASDYESAKIDLGLTGGEFDAFLDRTIANFSTHPMKGARFMCFDSIAPVVKMLHDAEMTLKSHNSTLKDEIIDSTKKKHLQELIRQSIVNVDTRIFSGKVKYQPGAHEVLVPAGFLQSQKRGKSRPAVFIDDGASSGEKGRLRFVNPIIWSTPNGKAPAMFPSIEEQLINVDEVAGKVLSAIALVTAAVFLMLSMIDWKQKQKTFLIIRIYSQCLYIGIICLLVLVFLYISTKLELFCRMAPALASIGLTLMSSSLLVRLYTPLEIALLQRETSSAIVQHSRTSNRQSRSANLNNLQLEEPPNWPRPELNQEKQMKRFKIACLFALVFLSVSFVSLAIWYGIGGMLRTSVTTRQTYDEINDIVHIKKWQICINGNNGYQVGAFLLALQFFMALFNFMTAVSKNRITSDKSLHKSLFCCFIYFPVMIFFIFLAFVITQPDVLFYLLSSLTIFIAWILSYFLFFKTANQIIVLPTTNNNSQRSIEHVQPSQSGRIFRPQSRIL